MRCLHTLHCLTGFLLATQTSPPWKQNGATVRCLHTLHCPTGFVCYTDFSTLKTERCNNEMLACTVLPSWISVSCKTSPPWKQNGATMRCLHMQYCPAGSLSATLTSLSQKQNALTTKCLCVATVIGFCQHRISLPWFFVVAHGMLVICSLLWLPFPKNEMLHHWEACVM